MAHPLIVTERLAGETDTHSEQPCPQNMERPVASARGAQPGKAFLLSSPVPQLPSAPERNLCDIIAGPGGQQVLLEDPAGNPVELFQPASR